MTLASLIQTYGYAAVFMGALLEGEIILVMAGFAAERRYLTLPWVMGAAVIGGFLGDQFYYHCGPTLWRAGAAASSPYEAARGPCAGTVEAS